MHLRNAQAESDKIEFMRDLGTYEAQASDNIKMKEIFTNLYTLVKSTVEQISTLANNDDNFIEDLTQKIQQTVQYGDRHSVAIRQGEHLQSLKRGLRRMDHGGIDMENQHKVH